ncbi:hypothetical protein OB919_06545 [Halobacteria archaeon AArc-curdl1]|uniref:RCK C-terminal domain-containing protein n=1 Tax=Natronosalvus hydrolyticus TaxID=2979988 RepID=A0AAP2Z909_9EURY|nr:hypothetical protein [Halobacteria archaeon AArc-curdl1]
MNVLPVVAPAFVSEWTHTALLNILGFGLLAGVMAMGTAFVYRRATIRPIPVGTAVVLGVAFPSLLLVIEAIMQGILIEPSPLIGYASGLYILGVFTGSVLASATGRHVGDHLACGVFDITTLEAGGSVAELVRSAELAVSLTVPDRIGDVPGYPPVGPERKRVLAGETLLFPRRLSLEELEDRLCRRLEEDYGIGQVHVEFGSDGGIERLALGRRSTGLSSTVPPETGLIAVECDPSPRSSAGDPVELWLDSDGERHLVTTGQLRSTADDVASVLIDDGGLGVFDADDGGSYRLTTRSDSPHDAHHLVGLIQTADETVTKTTVEPDDPLDGEFVDWLPATVLVLERAGELVAFPDGRETIRADDTVYAFGLPADIETLCKRSETSLST